MFLVSSCNKENPEPEPEPDPIPVTGCPVINVTANGIGETISTPTTWTAGNVYVITEQITVTSVLTIQPGVVVKLGIDGGIDVNGSGKILANGTANQRITFTSLADDSYCGDSNGDGTATVPQKGDWVNLYLNGGTGNTFTYCDFLYAGANDGGYRCAVVISVAGPSFTFDHCVFAHTQSSTNFTGGFAFYGGSYMSNPAVSVFTNNVFYDNDIPVYCNIHYSIDPNNSYSNPSNPSQGNTRNSIWMYVEHSANTTVTYTETEVPYIIDGNSQRYQGVLDIGPNVVVKFPATANGLSRTDPSYLLIHPTAILTSYKDDANGGDTNGDGNLSSPSNGDWDGVNIGSTNYLSAPNILYAAN